MTTALDSYKLWQRTLGVVDKTPANVSRERLRQSFLSFRERVSLLVSSIDHELPDLTVHNITHLDALWRVADVIAGDDYPLNPAEAYVLGGAFLLHDAAHVMAAYPEGLIGIKRTVQWQDLIAQRYGGKDPERNSGDERVAIFQVLRHLHARQAKELPMMEWRVADSDAPLHLIEDTVLRRYYGALIGEIASSHHWSPQDVERRFCERNVSCAAVLSPADWEVDVLKLALLLRTADAAHLDADRAPWFLFALRQPQGVSQHHWRFQEKMGLPSLSKHDELRLSSGSPFAEQDRNAWWLAFDTARMVDRELRNAYHILRDRGRLPFKAIRVLGVESAQAFANHVPVVGWEPVDVMPSVSNVPKLIERLGGAALYGEDYAVPLRELLQNALDAVAALRALGGLGPEEGEIEVALEPEDDTEQWWVLSVTDTGIGMSRYVLSNVLIDFGNSLWSSDALREELPGLSKADFTPVGKFGIGFYSVFMLGKEVVVTTRRFQRSVNEGEVNFQLRFEDGVGSRPVLITPSDKSMLSRPGTRVAVRLSADRASEILTLGSSTRSFGQVTDKKKLLNGSLDTKLRMSITRLCPASPVTITTRVRRAQPDLAIRANDWARIPDAELKKRLVDDARVLVPVVADGRTIGRLGLPSYSHNAAAAITYRGVHAGELLGLVGLVEAASNATDARREAALPAGTIEQWREWAMQIMSQYELTKRQMLMLHPLVPDRDFAVYTLGENHVTLKQLTAAFAKMDEIFVHRGEISYDGDLGLSPKEFDAEFSPAKKLLCLPSLWTIAHPVGFSRSFPWVLGVGAIDYSDIILRLLDDTWGQYEREFDERYEIGTVDEVGIFREVKVLRRVRFPN